MSNPMRASVLVTLTAWARREKPDPLQSFSAEMAALRNLGKIDYVVLNAGILKYPNVRPWLNSHGEA